MKFEKELIVGAIKPSAPYSPGVRCGPVIYTAATATDWKTGLAVNGTIEEETKRTIENLKRVLESAGSSLKDVIKATVYLTNFEEDFEKYNRVYASYFKEGGFPARATIGVTRLFGNGKIEIDVIALSKRKGRRKTK